MTESTRSEAGNGDGRVGASTTHAQLFSFEGNLVVAASAGTGKTHALVGVLVHLVLGASTMGGRGLHDPVDPARLVATTFSRKAAAEIRARFAGALEGLAVADPETKYRRDLDAAFERAGVKVSERELMRRARVALDRLGTAQIGTLHGFATQLVKSHALEIGIAPGFELLAEEEASAQAESVIEAAISRFATEEPEATRILVRASGGVDRLVGDIARILDSLGENGVDADSLLAPASDASEVEQTLRQLVQSMEPMRGHAKHGPAVDDVLRAFTANDEAALEEALTHALATIRKDDRQPTLADFLEVRERLDGGTNPERARRLFRLFRDRDALAPAARAARELVIRSQRDLARTRRRTSALAFGDVLRVARDLLRDRPDVAQEIGESLDALLVDEFQDTSRVQAELVRLLWERNPKLRTPGALPNAANLRTSGLLVVGDRKQSIYSFRGADVAVFAELCVALAGWRARENLRITSDDVELPQSPVAKFAALKDNWRSEPAILKFANAFSQVHLAGTGANLYDVAYAPEVEDLAAAKAAKGDDAPRVTWLRPAAEGTSKRIDEAHLIAARIADMMAAPPRPGASRGRAYRDFAVLAATNQMLDTMAFALLRLQIPYVVAGRGFFSAREVRDVVALLATLVRPNDRLALATVLRSPWVGVSDRALLALTAPQRGLIAPPPADLRAIPRNALLDANDRERLGAAFEVIARLRRNVDRIPPATLLREASRALGFEEVLAQLPRGAARVGNVHKLFNLAERTPTARALLAKLERAIEREAQETDAATFSEEDDAVRLLTIHASKGLAFPIVFVPQIGIDRIPRRPSGLVLETGLAGAPPRVHVRHVDRHGARVDPPSLRRAKEESRTRELAERRRLSYVALTRAEEEMVLVGRRKKTQGVAYASTIIATLDALAVSEESCARAGLLVEDQEIAVRAPAPRAAAAGEPAHVVAASDVKVATQSVAVTTLVDFHHCARRFELAHLLDVPEELPAALRGSEHGHVGDEPRAVLSPREEGTLLHATLERVPREAFGGAQAAALVEATLATLEAADVESKKRVTARALKFLGSEYAARIAANGALLRREVPFVLTLDHDADGLGKVGLRGAIDLIVEWPDGAVDVLDYKRARGPSPEPYALQLDAYALAAAAIVGKPVARTGIVFLGGGPAEPAFRTRGSDEELGRSLGALVARWIRARWTGGFPRAEISTCQRLRCGYVHLCHPKTQLVQLGLFAH